MEILWCSVVGILFGISIYLMLERHLLRVVFGLILLSNSVNLSLFICGRLTRANPPLIPSNMNIPLSNSANSLPQALVLTAIVISFGFILFTLSIAYRFYKANQTADIYRVQEATQEEEKS